MKKQSKSLHSGIPLLLRPIFLMKKDKRKFQLKFWISFLAFILLFGFLLIGFDGNSIVDFVLSLFALPLLFGFSSLFSIYAFFGFLISLSDLNKEVPNDEA